MSKRIVVVGTGTEIGKTHFGVTFLHALARAGVSVAGLKPVESGVGSGVTDADQLDRAGTFHVKHPPPYALRPPVSPHLAAREAGLTIRIGEIVRWVDLSEADWTLVETAGALLSPISPVTTNLDLAAALAPEAVVLVAPDRLGVLHDVTAALFAYRVLAPGLPEPVVVLQAPAVADGSTGGNGRELVELGIARTVVTMPRGATDAGALVERATEVARLLGVI
jgi:dethiobiotin synthetase